MLVEISQNFVAFSEYMNFTEKRKKCEFTFFSWFCCQYPIIIYFEFFLMRKTYTRSRTEGCYRPSSKVSVGLACVSRGWKKEGRHMLVFFFLFPKEFYLYFIVHNRSRSLTSWSRFKLWFLGWAFQLSWFKIWMLSSLATW